MQSPWLQGHRRAQVHASPGKTHQETGPGQGVLLFQGHRLTALQGLCIAVILGFSSPLCVDHFLKIFPSFTVLTHLIEQIRHWKAIF